MHRGGAPAKGASGHDDHRGSNGRGGAGARGEAAVPRHCRVDGHVAVPGNEVNFRARPAGSVERQVLLRRRRRPRRHDRNLNTGLARGYASASTDTGHQSSDPTWGANRAKEIDYGHRGTHVTAVAGKALTAAFYGRPPQHAYFNGCSNGGRQALMEVQRYPDDFDGIIAGDPATGTPMQVGRALVFQHMLLAGKLPDDRQGRAAVESDAGGVRQEGRPQGRPHHRPAAVHVQAGDVEVRRRGWARLPDRGPGRDREEDLRRR